MKKTYEAPVAEVVTFAKEDVITSSGYIFNWDTPSMGMGGFSWDEASSTWN